MKFFLAIVTFVCVTTVQANHDIAIVEALQGTAKLQRADHKKDLAVDMVLQKGDIITTEKNTRVWITFQDDSMLKLGEKSRIALDKLLPSTEEQPLSAVFRLTTGVFRFFTNTETERDIQINVGQSITLGIRGTDLFVGATSEKDWICLVKGVIDAQVGETITVLDKSRQFLVVPKNKLPLPIEFVTDEQFGKWVRSTELQTTD